MKMSDVRVIDALTSDEIDELELEQEEGLADQYDHYMEDGWDHADM